MRIIVNNEPREVAPGTTVQQLIAELGLATAICAAEVNQSLVPRSARDRHVLAEGDRVELVVLVGGG